LKSSLNIPKTVDFVLKHNENLMYVPDESYTLPRNLKETMDKYSDDIASSSFNTKPCTLDPTRSPTGYKKATSNFSLIPISSWAQDSLTK